MEPDAVPSRRLDARIRNLGGKLLVGGPREVLELTETAAFVWNRIDGDRTIRDLGAAIARHVEQGYRLDMIMPADGPRIALLSRDGERLRLEGHKERVFAVAFAPDGLSLASGDASGTGFVWDLRARFLPGMTVPLDP